MAEKRAFVVCGIVGFLGILSAALACGAGAIRPETPQVFEGQFGTHICSYPGSPAYGLAITAAISLLIAQVIVNVSTGCICCRKSPHPGGASLAVAVICLVLSWLMFVFTFLTLLGGAALSDRRSYNVYSVNSDDYCYVLNSGVFVIAAVLAIITIALGIAYHLAVTSTKAPNGPLTRGFVGLNQNGIAMGQPQVPPTSLDTVFAQEDAYMRRQFS